METSASKGVHFAPLDNSVKRRGGEGVRFAVSPAIANSGKRRIMSKAISIVFYMRSKK